MLARFIVAPNRLLGTIIILLVLTSVTLGSLIVTASFTVTTDKSSYKRGEEVKIIISNAPPNVPVGIQVIDPNGNTQHADQVTTDADGRAVSTFRIGSDWPLGTYTVYASITGVGRESTTFEVVKEEGPPPPPSKEKSSISICVSKTEVSVGEEVIIEGAISPAVANATVYIEYKVGLRWVILGTTTTNETGGYNYTWVPTAAGNYTLRARWLGNEMYYGATSDTVTVIVKKATLKIEISAPEKVAVGEVVKVTVRTEPKLQEAVLNVKVAPPVGSITEMSVTVKEGHAEFEFKASVPGIWEITVIWPGNEVYARSEARATVIAETETSTTLMASKTNVTVGDVVVLYGSVSPAPYEGTVELLVKSNGDWIKMAEVPLDKKGNFIYVWETKEPGVFKVKAVWSGAPGFKPSESNVVVIQVLTNMSVTVTTPEGEVLEEGYVEIYTIEGKLVGRITLEELKKGINLPPGKYTVKTYYKGIVVDVREIEVKKAFSYSVTVELHDVEIIVRDVKGAPIEGAVVVIIPEKGEPLMKITDKFGVAKFFRLPPGKYIVKVAGPGETVEKVIEIPKQLKLTVTIYTLQNLAADLTLRMALIAVITAIIAAAITYVIMKKKKPAKAE